MGIITKKASSFKKNSNQNKSIYSALVKVTGYDEENNLIIGTMLDKGTIGEEVAFSFEPMKKTGDGDKERPEVDFFVNGGGDRAAPEGSILKVDNVRFADGETEFGGRTVKQATIRWAEAISRSSKDQYTVECPASIVRIGKAASGKMHGSVAVVYSDTAKDYSDTKDVVANKIFNGQKPVLCTSPEAVEEAVKQMLASNLHAGIRERAGDDIGSSIIFKGINKSEDEMLADVREAYANDGEKFASGEMVVEVIPVASVGIAPKTAQALDKASSKASKYVMDTLRQVDEANNRAVSIYTACTLVVNDAVVKKGDQKGTEFIGITKIIPVAGAPKHVGIYEMVKNAITENVEVFALKADAPESRAEQSSTPAQESSMKAEQSSVSESVQSSNEAKKGDEDEDIFGDGDDFSFGDAMDPADIFGDNNDSEARSMRP